MIECCFILGEDSFMASKLRLFMSPPPPSRDLIPAVMRTGQNSVLLEPPVQAQSPLQMIFPMSILVDHSEGISRVHSTYRKVQIACELTRKSIAVERKEIQKFREYLTQCSESCKKALGEIRESVAVCRAERIELQTKISAARAEIDAVSERIGSIEAKQKSFFDESKSNDETKSALSKISALSLLVFSIVYTLHFVTKSKHLADLKLFPCKGDYYV